jgi:hypothetical protein
MNKYILNVIDQSFLKTQYIIYLKLTLIVWTTYKIEKNYLYILRYIFKYILNMLMFISIVEIDNILKFINMLKISLWPFYILFNKAYAMFNSLWFHFAVPLTSSIHLIVE